MSFLSLKGSGFRQLLVVMIHRQNIICLSYGEGSFKDYYLNYLKEKYGDSPPPKDPPKKFPIFALLIIVAAIICNLIFSPVIWELLGNEDITKKPDGIYCYYVTIQNDKYGPYTLPAAISKSDKNYYAYRNFWPNGGYIEAEAELYLDRSSVIEDEDWREWEVILLNQKAKNENVKETNVLEEISIMREFWFWTAVPIIIFVVYLIWYYRSANHKPS